MSQSSVSKAIKQTLDLDRKVISGIFFNKHLIIQSISNIYSNGDIEIVMAQTKGFMWKLIPQESLILSMAIAGGKVLFNGKGQRIECSML